MNRRKGLETQKDMFSCIVPSVSPHPLSHHPSGLRPVSESAQSPMGHLFIVASQGFPQSMDVA